MLYEEVMLMELGNEVQNLIDKVERFKHMSLDKRYIQKLNKIKKILQEVKNETNNKGS